MCSNVSNRYVTISDIVINVFNYTLVDTSELRCIHEIYFSSFPRMKCESQSHRFVQKSTTFQNVRCKVLLLYSGISYIVRDRHSCSFWWLWYYLLGLNGVNYLLQPKLNGGPFSMYIYLMILHDTISFRASLEKNFLERIISLYLEQN